MRDEIERDVLQHMKDKEQALRERFVVIKLITTIKEKIKNERNKADINRKGVVVLI